MIPKKVRETAFFIAGLALVWVFFGRQIRGFFTNIAGQLNLTPAPQQPEQKPIAPPPVTQPPVTQPPVTQPPVTRPPVLPAIPSIPRMPLNFSLWDRLPWENNRTRIDIMEAIINDMRRIKSFPYNVAATFPEVMGAGGVTSYLNSQLRRFNAAATQSILKASQPTVTVMPTVTFMPTPATVTSLVQDVQLLEDEVIIPWKTGSVQRPVTQTPVAQTPVTQTPVAQPPVAQRGVSRGHIPSPGGIYLPMFVE